MTDLQIADYWNDVADESHRLIAAVHQLYTERLALIEQRQWLLREYNRLGAQIRESAMRVLI